MKSIILGIIGTLITLYTFLIGVDILVFQINKNEMEKQVSRIVKHVLEEEYLEDDEATVRQMLIEEIRSSLSSGNTVQIEVKGMDLQKGLLSVRVVQYVRMLNGKEREIVVEKTAIIERSMWSEIDLGGELN